MPLRHRHKTRLVTVSNRTTSLVVIDLPDRRDPRCVFVASIIACILNTVYPNNGLINERIMIIRAAPGLRTPSNSPDRVRHL